MTNTLTPYEQREHEVITLLQAKSKAIQKLVPGHKDLDRLKQVLWQVRELNPQIRECSPESQLGAMLTAFQYGLEPGGPLGQCCIVPRKIKGVKKAQFELMYRGCIALASHSPNFAFVHASCVYKGIRDDGIKTVADDFAYELGTVMTIRHIPNDEVPHDAGNITHAYAVVGHKDGSKNFVVLRRDELNKIRNMSQSARSGGGPWDTHFAEMAMKSAIKRVLKMEPGSAEMHSAIGSDDLAEIGKDQHVEVVVSDFAETIEDKENEALKDANNLPGGD